jgi:hypothetical protein
MLSYNYCYQIYKDMGISAKLGLKYFGNCDQTSVFVISLKSITLTITEGAS